MRKTIMLALVAGSLAAGGGIAAVATEAHAQGAPPAAAPAADDATMPGGAGPGMHRPPMGFMGHGPMGGADRGPMGRMHGGMMRRMRAFALIYPVADRNLSGADVQKIAEAFLLFNGNHTWKVTEVKEEPNRVTFALATPDGTAIAHFAMDRHTARPQRLN
ncbi:hypothetical protein [Acidisphaera sp. L21]|uniref:hypothetical protein n=1 Tax=Acidisphaera sp. L21 TaxID=1641851 RepID=UPI00131BAB60|nr:hypothetical protein [Acidisphaera sp. L21]